jgi:hypothetical protein
MQAQCVFLDSGFALSARPGMTLMEAYPLSIVMAGHSRPKDGVLSHAYVPAIHVFADARS